MVAETAAAAAQVAATPPVADAPLGVPSDASLSAGGAIASTPASRTLAAERTSTPPAVAAEEAEPGAGGDGGSVLSDVGVDAVDMSLEPAGSEGGWDEAAPPAEGSRDGDAGDSGEDEAPEAVQVAAMAVKFIDMLDAGRGRV